MLLKKEQDKHILYEVESGIIFLVLSINPIPVSLSLICLFMLLLHLLSIHKLIAKVNK